jgi:glycosidase
VSNHDKNAWDGTEFEQFGEGLNAALVLSFVGDGMPLIYNGQEAGSAKRLAFFERDPIQWREHELADFYQKLIVLKKTKSALANGQWGAVMRHVPNSSPSNVFSFVRQDQAGGVFVVLNLSDQKVKLSFLGTLQFGIYTDYFTKKNTNIDTEFQMELAPWDYRVWIK